MAAKFLASLALLGAAGIICIILLGTGSWSSQGHQVELVDKIKYVGIVPYLVHPRSKRVVACTGQSSVNCIFGDLADSIHKGLADDDSPTAGKLAVKKAAIGQGFSWVPSNRYNFHHHLCKGKTACHGFSSIIKLTFSFHICCRKRGQKAIQTAHKAMAKASKGSGVRMCIRSTDPCF
jgi:hypothetical protein